MNTLEKILFMVTIFIVAFHSKLKAQNQYYNKAKYPYDTCNIKYNSSNHFLILYSGNNIDTLLMRKNKKIQLEYLKFNTDRASIRYLKINGKLVIIKKGLDGFWDYEDKMDIDIKYSQRSHYSGGSNHGSHYSHISHYSSN